MYTNYTKLHSHCTRTNLLHYRTWVSKMLGEMQTSIEAHINNAMKGAGGSGSGSEKE